mmetsp:Transcript_182/g.372  ORF Transcript_182/g.372 Transcript_182/m.372 type:complete len:336 (+) Transcript_182:665-1672(+)
MDLFLEGVFGEPVRLDGDLQIGVGGHARIVGRSQDGPSGPAPLGDQVPEVVGLGEHVSATGPGGQCGEENHQRFVGGPVGDRGGGTVRQVGMGRRRRRRGTTIAGGIILVALVGDSFRFRQAFHPHDHRVGGQIGRLSRDLGPRLGSGNGRERRVSGLVVVVVVVGFVVLTRVSIAIVIAKDVANEKVAKVPELSPPSLVVVDLVVVCFPSVAAGPVPVVRNGTKAGHPVAGADQLGFVNWLLVFALAIAPLFFPGLGYLVVVRVLGGIGLGIGRGLFGGVVQLELDVEIGRDGDPWKFRGRNEFGDSLWDVVIVLVFIVEGFAIGLAFRFFFFP